MFVRVVRFTGVEADRFAHIREEVDERGGPPEGVKATGLKIFHDAEQGTAVVLQYFETEQDMRDSEAAFDRMDPGDTPGTRASVDRCEVVLEVEV